MTTQRGAFIFDFLVEHENYIKALLAEAVHPDMIRVDVYIANATQGTPKIIVETMEPSGGEKLLVHSIQRPFPYMPQAIAREIENVTFYHMVSMLVNQVDII